MALGFETLRKPGPLFSTVYEDFGAILVLKLSKMGLGEWKGQGESPDGPYEYDLSYTGRGRWIVGATDIRLTGGGLALQVIAVLGRDKDGKLVTCTFESDAGVVVFQGRIEGHEIRLEWKEGEDWRRSMIALQQDGSLRFEGTVHLSSPPPGVPSDSVFNSVARRNE